MSQGDGKFIKDYTIYLKSLRQNGATAGQAIVWNGVQWAPATVVGAGGPVDFTFEGAVIIKQDSSFLAGTRGIRVKASKDVALEVTGSVSIGSSGSMQAGPTSSVRVRSI